MTYDLRRFRLHSLIERIPHTNTYEIRLKRALSISTADITAAARALMEE